MNVALLFALMSECTGGTIENLKETFVNVSEIQFDLSDCSRWESRNSSSMQIYDNNNCVKYDCMVTEMFDSKLIQNAYHKQGLVYEYDFEKWWDKLSENYVFNAETGEYYRKVE